MGRVLLALFSVACLTTSATAAQPALMLLTEHQPNGDVLYWWHCGERQPQPFSDRLAPHLTRLGLRVIDRCDKLETPIHKSFQKPDLKPFQQANLGNALEAKRLITGALHLTTKPAVATLGLAHVEAAVTLEISDLDSGDRLGTLSHVGHGFDSDAHIAGQRALDILLARVLVSVPDVFKQRATAPTSTTRVRLRGVARPTDLDAQIARARAVTSVRAVTVLELTRRGALLRVDPPAAAAAGVRALTAAGVDTSLEAQNL